MRAEAAHPGPECLPSPLHFIGPDVTGARDAFGAGLPALVADQGGAAAVGAPGDGIKGRAAGQQGVREGGAAVVLQGPEPWIDAWQVGGVGQQTAGIAVQVIACGGD